MASQEGLDAETTRGCLLGRGTQVPAAFLTLCPESLSLLSVTNQAKDQSVALESICL